MPSERVDSRHKPPLVLTLQPLSASLRAASAPASPFEQRRPRGAGLGASWALRGAAIPPPRNPRDRWQGPSVSSQVAGVKGRLARRSPRTELPVGAMQRKE